MHRCGFDAAGILVSSFPLLQKELLMFLHLLDEQNRTEFLELAHLLCVSDNPLLWDGKAEAELTGEADLSKVAFQRQAAEEELLASIARECGDDSLVGRILSGLGSGAKTALSPQTAWPFPTGGSGKTDSTAQGRIERALLSRLKPLPLGRQNALDERQKAAVAVLIERLQVDSEARPEVAKIMLFELMLLSLADGVISEVERALLKVFAERKGIPDYLFDDLLECAEGTNRQASKTVSIIFE